MKRITYAGETVLTSDDVATVLVELTAALARRGLSEAVVIPIVSASGRGDQSAELVVGQGNDVLAVPDEGDRDEPDFSAGVAVLREKIAAVTPRRSVAQPSADDGGQVGFDDLELELGKPESLQHP
jgi:hypothetical protein